MLHAKYGPIPHSLDLGSNNPFSFTKCTFDVFKWSSNPTFEEKHRKQKVQVYGLSWQCVSTWEASAKVVLQTVHQE